MHDPVAFPARDRKPGEVPAARQTEGGVWTERMLECLRKGGPEGGRWFSLIDKVWREETLLAGFSRVAANDGAPGVDGKDVEWFRKHQDEEIAYLSHALKAGTYRPDAVKRAWIPKPGSDEQRPLGIPTVRDRVVQAALKLVIEPIFEATFSPHSHGFRPGRNAKDALELTHRHLHQGKTWAIDADLKGYFDSIPHARLLAAVSRKIADRRILALIRLFLEAGIMEGLTLSEPESGTPQGGVISPLLANIYLDDLDHTMAQSGVTMERYADDFVIFCPSETEAIQAMARLQEWTARAGLTLHPTKTRIVDLMQDGAYIDFLGYRFKRSNSKDGRSRILRLVRPKSLAKITDAIRECTPRKMATSQEMAIRKLNQRLKGWFGYFRSAITNIHHDLDGFVRRRLRSQLCKANRMSCWGAGTANLKWSNAYFAGLGLFSLEEAHAQYCQSRKRETQ